MLRYRVNASDLMYHLGRFEEALQLAEEGIARARELGVERSSGVILASNAVEPLLALGQWDRGEALIDRTLALAPPPAFRVYLQRAKLWVLLWPVTWMLRRSYRSRGASITGPNNTAPNHTEAQTLLGTARVLAELALAQGDLDAAWTPASVLYRGTTTQHCHRTILPLLTVGGGHRCPVPCPRRKTAPGADQAWVDDAEASVPSAAGDRALLADVGRSGRLRSRQNSAATARATESTSGGAR